MSGGPADGHGVRGQEDTGTETGATAPSSGGLTIPPGRQVASRVMEGPGEALAAALERELTGYLVLEPGNSLLLDERVRGVLTVEDGVPVLAYADRDPTAGRVPSPGNGPGGPAALAALAAPGPCRASLHELPATALARAHETTGLRVPPGMPAEDLAADVGLAERTRERAPADRITGEPSAVEAFLADESRIEAIRAEAREEARARAAEWGLDDVLEE